MRRARGHGGSVVRMLVLSRRTGESVVLGEDITITVIEVRGDVVRIGIDAPRSVPVHRGELLEQLTASNREAASPDQTVVASLRDQLRSRPD